MSIKQNMTFRRKHVSSTGFRQPKNQHGVSLIELMVGITVGLIILAGVVTVVAKTSFSGLENIRSVQLNQQLRGAMDVMHRELQRAGYVNSWTPGSTSVATGFDTAAIALFGSVTLGGACAGGVCDCILYSYDRYPDGAPDGAQGTSGAGFELFGFRLNNGVIQRRTSGDPQACNSGGWQPMTDASVTVTALGFELDTDDEVVYEIVGDGVDLDGDGFADCQSTETCLARRKVNISINGELTSDSDLDFDLRTSVDIRQEVKIKNDHYYVAP